MIEVRVRKNEIKVSGHAMYAPHGQDIVCAGVSSLVRTLIRSIEDLTRDEIEYKVSPGWVDIQYGNLSEKARTLVDSFFVGICMIADEYPDCVRIVYLHGNRRACSSSPAQPYHCRQPSSLLPSPYP